MRRLWPLVPVYVALLLWVDRGVTLHGQYALGALTWLVLIAAAWTLSPQRRAQVAVVVAAATVGEVTGSLIWGVYHYRLDNLPLFVPPAHGLVYLTGIALAASLRRHTRALVVAAAVAAVAWGVAGLTVLPRLDVAGALGVPLLCLFLWRSRARATYAGVFFAVAALELYGTAIGTWQWERALPGLRDPRRQPAERRRERLRLVRRDGAPAGARAAQDGAGSAKPNRGCGASVAASVILRNVPTGTMSSVTTPASGSSSS